MKYITADEAVTKLIETVKTLRGALEKRDLLTFGRTGIPSRGIIPACAGLTSEGKIGDIKRWDHPRVCGAHAPSSDC